MKNAKSIQEIQARKIAEQAKEISVQKEKNERLEAELLFLKQEYQKLRKLIFGANLFKLRSNIKSLSFILLS